MIYQRFETIRLNKNNRNKTSCARRILYRLFFAEFLLNGPVNQPPPPPRGSSADFSIKNAYKTIQSAMYVRCSSTYLRHTHCADMRRESWRAACKLISVVRIIFYIIIISIFFSVILTSALPIFSFLTLSSAGCLRLYMTSLESVFRTPRGLLHGCK